MLNCEYSYFAKQMKYQAESEDFRAAAAAASPSPSSSSSSSSTSLNISGVYKSSSNNPFDERKWDLFLATIKCPWVFRKLIVASSANIRDVFITQDADVMIFKYKVKFFGTRELIYRLDGKKRDILNLWKVQVTQEAFIDEKRGVVCVLIKPHPALLPDGYTEHTFYNRVNAKGEKELVWE